MTHKMIAERFCVSSSNYAEAPNRNFKVQGMYFSVSNMTDEFDHDLVLCPGPWDLTKLVLSFVGSKDIRFKRRQFHRPAQIIDELVCGQRWNFCLYVQSNWAVLKPFVSTNRNVSH